MGRVREEKRREEKRRRKKIKKRKSPKKQDPGVRKGRKVAKHISKSKSTKQHMYAPLLDVEASFRVAGAGHCAPCQKRAKREGFVACPKTMAGVGHLKRICKDAFSMAGAVQETCSSEM